MKEQYDSHHLRLHEDGPSPICPECGLGTWVELGGGEAYHSYHPNIDGRAVEGVDIVHDLRKGIPLHNEHAHRIKSIHCIQHLGRDGLRFILKECLRVLKPGGSLYIMIGDMRWAFQKILEEGFTDQWLEFVWGEQMHEFDYHTWGVDFSYMKNLLEEAEFVNIIDRGHYNPWEIKLEGFKPFE